VVLVQEKLQSSGRRGKHEERIATRSGKRSMVTTVMIEEGTTVMIEEGTTVMIEEGTTADEMTAMTMTTDDTTTGIGDNEQRLE
jgi:hypothetical protein